MPAPEGRTKAEGDAEWHDPQPHSNPLCPSAAAETDELPVCSSLDDILDELVVPATLPHVITASLVPMTAPSSGSKPLQPIHHTVMTAVIARMRRRREDGRRIIGELNAVVA